MERKAAYRSHVRGSASDPVEGGGSKDSLQDRETENDTNTSNKTTGHERDELKEADLETENIWVRFCRKLRAYSHSLMKIWRNLTTYRPRRSAAVPEVSLSQLADEDKDDDDDYGSNDGCGVEGSSWELNPEQGIYYGGSEAAGVAFSGYLVSSASCEPNPGIKRPTVSVLQTPPPPHP